MTDGDRSTVPRPLTPADVQPARALVHRVLGSAPYAARVLELLAEADRGAGDLHALLLEHRGATAALALFGPVPGARDVWMLRTLLLDPEHDVSNAGRVLLDDVIGRARTLGARMLVAEFPADPAYGRTLSLLRACDFDQDGRIPDFFRAGVALLFLRRTL